MINIADVRAQYCELIDADRENNRKGAQALVDNMERSDLYFRGRFTSKTLQIPRLYSKKMIDQFKEIVRISHGIFVKVIEEYRKCADYRALFDFPKEAEELICLSTGYDALLPIARFDIFYHEDTGKFWFCEINTDGSSGMNEDRLQDAFILHNPAHQEMRRRFRMRPMELFDSWVETFLKLYDSFENRVPEPNVAIVDFMDGGTVREFEEFARHFQKAGVNCEICDIRDLSYRDGKLYSPSGHVVDAIYRRAVTTDILSSMDAVRPFIDAVRDKAVFLAGSFCTQVIHHKRLFYALHLPRTHQFLTKEEIEFVKAHVPWTAPFTKEHIDPEKVKADKDRYILKPEDSYASQGVYAGVEHDQEEWEKLVSGSFENGYICQEYCPQHSAENIDFVFGDGQWHSYIDMAGLYAYNGEFAGVFSRAALGSGIIASHRNERTQATYIVEEK